MHGLHTKGTGRPTHRAGTEIDHIIVNSKRRRRARMMRRRSAPDLRAARSVQLGGSGGTYRAGGRVARAHQEWATRTGHNRSRDRRSVRGVGVGRPSRPISPPQPPPPAHARAVEDPPKSQRVKHRPGGPPLRRCRRRGMLLDRHAHSGPVPFCEI